MDSPPRKLLSSGLKYEFSEAWCKSWLNLKYFKLFLTSIDLKNDLINDLINDHFCNFFQNHFLNSPFSLSLLMFKWYFIIKSRVVWALSKIYEIKIWKKSKILYKLNKSQWTWKMHYWVTQSVQLRASDSIPILHLQLSLTFRVNWDHPRLFKIIEGHWRSTWN